MSEPEIAGLRVLQSEGRATRPGGNQILLDETPGNEALLKVYRRRRTWLRETAKRFSYRVIERRSGVTAEQRCAIERERLSLWRARGFDVPALLDRPIPAGLSPKAALWMEYCPGPLLSAFTVDGSRTVAEREQALERFGNDLGTRQSVTLAQGEYGLVMKGASIKNVLLYEGRQVSFDLESAYLPGGPILGALADELGGSVRSLLRWSPATCEERFQEAFLCGYGRSAQLSQIVDFGLRRGGLSRALRRFVQRYRREETEYAALCWVEERLSA